MSNEHLNVCIKLSMNRSGHSQQHLAVRRPATWLSKTAEDNVHEAVHVVDADQDSRRTEIEG